VLDNAEHVPEVAPFVAELLAAAPPLRILVTSRQPLRIAAEREFALDPLPVPPERAVADPTALLDYPAVRLFVERAEAVRPDSPSPRERFRSCRHLPPARRPAAGDRAGGGPRPRSSPRRRCWPGWTKS
jgi:hypothetical protein